MSSVSSGRHNRCEEDASRWSFFFIPDGFTAFADDRGTRSIYQLVEKSGWVLIPTFFLVVVLPSEVNGRPMCWSVWCFLRRQIPSIRRGDSHEPSSSSAGSFSGYKADWSRSAAQDGIKNIYFFFGKEVCFKQCAPIASGEED